MAAILVDSNVLLDVMTSDPDWGAWSAKALEAGAEGSRLVINPIIFAEVSVRFTRIEELEAALPNSLIERDPVPYEAAFLAAKAFLEYRKRGGAKLNTLPDFFVGAHALVAGYRLLTRDARRYRTYFPLLGIIAPS